MMLQRGEPLAHLSEGRIDAIVGDEGGGLFSAFPTTMKALSWKGFPSTSVLLFLLVHQSCGDGDSNARNKLASTVS